MRRFLAVLLGFLTVAALAQIPRAPAQFIVVSGGGGGGSQGGGGIDPEADWTSRTSGGGVFFTENFDYASLSVASTHATNPKYYGASNLELGAPDPDVYAIVDDNALSGRALRITKAPQNGANANVWLYTWEDNDGIQVDFEPSSMKANFYFQVIVQMDDYVNWPWLLSGDPNGGSGEFSSPKIFQIGRADDSTIPGEIVITSDHNMQFVTVYQRQANGSSTELFERGNINTPQDATDWQLQPGIDTGTCSSASTMQEFRERCGPMKSDQLGGSSYGSIGNSTRLTDNATYNTAFTQASVSGVPWSTTERVVFEIMVSAATSRIAAWGAIYGDEPKLLFDSDDLAASACCSDLSWLASVSSSTAIEDLHIGHGFQLDNFVTGNIDAGGANQPTFYTHYLELIGSEDPIEFPGGFGLNFGSALEQAADAIADGDTASFSISGLDLSAESPASVTSAATFAGRLVYDDVRRKVHFLGTSHTGGTPTSGAGAYVTYDLDADDFNRTEYTWSATGVMGHAYYHLTVNPADGTLYNIAMDTQDSYKAVDGSTTWTTSFIANHPTDNGSQWSVASEWFPEANSGAGGWATCDYDRCFISNAAVTSWTTGSSTHDLPNGDLWSAHVDGYVHFGRNTDHYRLAPDGSVSSRAAPPISASTNNRNGEGWMVTDPTNSADMLLFERQGSLRVWRYSQSGNDWTEIGTHEFEGDDNGPFTVLGAIDPADVVMGWIHSGGNPGTTTAELWKVPPE
jgi:hypothetical protein